MKRKWIAWILAIALMLSFCACSAQETPESQKPESSSGSAPAPESSDAGSSDAGSSGTESSQNETSQSESSGEESSGQEPSARILAPQAKAVENAENLFDITAMIPAYDEMSLTDFAMQGANRLLLLYKQKTYFGEFDPAFTLSVLDLETGEVEVLTDRRTLDFGTDDPVDVYQVSLAGSDPPIVTESISATAYYPDDTDGPSLRLGPGGYISKGFCANGILYVLNSKGDLYYSKKTGNSGETGKVWSAGCMYQNVSMKEITDTHVVLTVDPLADPVEDSVCISVSLASGEIDESYTLEQGADAGSFYVAKNCGIRKRSADDGSWVLAVSDTSGGEYVCEFPKTDEFSPFTENGWMTIGEPDAEEGSICFVIRSSEGERMFLWDYSRNEARKAESAGKIPYDCSVLPQDADTFAAELEARYGVDLLLREEAVDPDERDYDVKAENDDADIVFMLSLLAKAFPAYPEGFFAELGSEKLKIGIVSVISGSEQETLNQAHGLTYSGDPGKVLLHSGSTLKTVFHEFGHVIMNKLCRDGYNNDMMGNFNELNPVGFVYYYTYNYSTQDGYWDYTPLTEDPGERYENVYFPSDYAKVSNSEDVAEIMGVLMSEENVPAFYAGVHMREKCLFLFERIRAVYDTSDWPEKTFWEERLDEAIAAADNHHGE